MADRQFPPLRSGILDRFGRRLDGSRFYRLLLVAALLGLAVGSVAAGFRTAWLFAKHHLWATFPALYWRIPISALAGLVIGGIYHLTFYPGALSALIEQFHTDGQVPLDEIVPALPAGWLGLITGQTIGPEGVMSIVGGSFGTYLADSFTLDSAKKLLTLAGMGAGFGTILGAPIGGAMIWLEMPHDRGVEYYEAIVPTLVASFAGYLLVVTVGGLSLFPTWNAESIVPIDPGQLFVAIAVGAVCIPLAVFYTRLFGAVGRVFQWWSPAVYVRTTVAGLAFGTLGFLIPLTYFYGGSQINTVLTGSFTLPVLGAILLGDMLAAAISVQGNWIGGLIVPHMFMGSVIGRAAAVVVPGIAPAAGMLAGMAAFNAAVTGTPLSSALIAIALTNGAGVTPAFLASLTAFLASPSIGFLEETAPRSESPGLHIAEDD